MILDQRLSDLQKKSKDITKAADKVMQLKKLLIINTVFSALALIASVAAIIIILFF